MTFLEALREQVEVRKSRRGRLLLRRLDAMTPARRARVLVRMEAHARTHLVAAGMASATGVIDWSSIDWSKVLDVILKILMAILPFLLMLSPTPPAARRGKARSRLPAKNE